MKIKDSLKQITLTGALGSLLILCGCSQTSSAGGPPEKRPLPEVAVIKIMPRPVSLTMELSGRTSSYLLAEVRPQVGGIILKRLFTEGSQVEAGQVLYRIDPATYKADYDNALASLKRAEANLIPARLKEERFRELVNIKAVSRQDYDDVGAALKLAEADIVAARSAVESARINLAYTKVKAPISGWIGRSAVTPGALVTANQEDTLAIIRQLDPVYVDVTQTSADLLRLKRDLAAGKIKADKSGAAKVRLLLEDGTPYPLQGTMKFSEVSVNENTGSVTLRAIFPNPDKLLLPGMFVRAIVEEGINEQAILVPQRGVSRNPKGQALVMIVGAEEKVEPRIIKVTRTVDDNWLVEGGLKAGDRVIVEGVQKARPGSQVKAIPFSPEAEASSGKAVQSSLPKK